MINIFALYKEIFSQIIDQIATDNAIKIGFDELAKISTEPAKDINHGDLATNAAMVMVKNFLNTNLKNPRNLAEEIVRKLKENENFSLDISKVEIAGAGFINIFFKPHIWQNIIFDLVNCDKIIYPNIGKNEKVNLEYASPNPTGPIHVGHTRGAIYGDVLANLLVKVGFDVLREYYINDAGSQITTLIKSAYLRYLEAMGEKIEISEGLYPGEYLIDIGKKIYAKFSDSLKDKTEEEYSILIRDFVIAEMVEMIKSDLLALGIKHDSYFSEKQNLHDQNKIPQTIKILEEQGLIYQGKLETPKTEKGVGAKDFRLPEGYDEKDQTLFRSTKFGDDQDRVVRKSDGSYTYFGADLAYIYNKFQRGATKFIMPLGYDHAGYVKRLTAATKALTNDKAELKIILCQMVKFVKNGEPLKMSKRAGNFITAKEVIDEVGADVLRFLMLSRKNDAPFDFDLTKAIEQSKDNMVFYLQYAHARCCSIIKQAEKLTDIENIQLDREKIKLLDHPLEIELMKKICQFPRLIEISALNFEPHRLAFFLSEIAADFHALWNYGSENIEAKFVIEDNIEITSARIYLVKATKKIIAEILTIFSVQPLSEM